MTVAQIKTPPSSDITEIKRAISMILFQPGDVIELRALNIAGKTHAGYFSDFDKLANAAVRLSGKADGVYVVLNQINPELLARAANRLVIGPKNLTQDRDIIRRRWLPIDIDAKRPAGISSTDIEHEAAMKTAYNIRAWLFEEMHFPLASLVLGDSGNGAHLLARIDLPNDTESETLVKACIKAVASKFDSDAVTIDQSVFNAARIWKLPGTMACKGDSTSERPHRIARIKEFSNDHTPDAGTS
jgi:hypothetical protein